MFDPLSERKERKKRRKEHQRTARIKKLLHAAREGVNSVKGRIVDPVWNHLARQLASDPNTDPALVPVIETALETYSRERSAREKARNKLDKERRQQEQIRQAEIAKELDLKVQSLSVLKGNLDLEGWCLYLAENPELRKLVGVRNRPFKITVAENAIMKAKEREVSARKYIYRTSLIKRGWTAELIDAVLGAPDKLVPNPHYRSGPPSMLYWTIRVEAAERARENPKFHR
jgi:hypothetical protein